MRKSQLFISPISIVFCIFVVNISAFMIDTSIFQGKKAAYCSLGCKLNFSETSTFGEALESLGVRIVEKGEVADLCLINTCSVTEVADHKSRQFIHRMVRENPGAFIVVTGCYAQLKPREISEMDGVDLVLGANEKANLIQYLNDAWIAKKSADDFKNDFHAVPTREIKSFQHSCSRGNRTRYFLKVQDGCNYMCTYCTIPYARGFSRSPSIASLVEQAKKAAQEGGKEIVLTGVNIGDFRNGADEKLIDLVKALDKVEGIERFRISSIEPDLLTDELIDYCSGSRAFMPHFHIPLQSGSDEVLKLMRRHYDTALFAHKIHYIKKKIPDCFIGVDVMVGTRGEKPEYFEDCYRFLDGLDVTQLHVFPYSERPGTRALKIPYIVGDKEKKQRSKRLLSLSEQKRQAFYAAHIGEEAEVLFEKASTNHRMQGFTDNYIRVELSCPQENDAYDNEIVKVKLGDFNFNKSALKASICE